MVKLINAVTGGEMWVHESRVDEYLARGHKLAPHQVFVHPAPPKPVKKPRSKTNNK